jgi:hypothetical protein
MKARLMLVDSINITGNGREVVAQRLLMLQEQTYWRAPAVRGRSLIKGTGGNHRRKI